MIRLTFEYCCDFCGKDILGADVFMHGADFGRYPQPRHVTKVGPNHACIACEKIAAEALADVVAAHKLRVASAAPAGHAGAPHRDGNSSSRPTFAS